MAVNKALLILFLFKAVVGGEVDIMNPRRRCVPTTMQLGNCYVCMCKTDGVFHCRALKCDIYKNATDPSVPECAADYTYRLDTVFCTCDETGHWRAENCKERFLQMRSRNTHISLKMRTNIECTSNHFYIFDCNVCVCIKGYINFEACTNRKCGVKSKLDLCNPGDVIRTDNEFCACSDINMYIDTLCIKMTDDPLQKVDAKALDSIMDFGTFWDDFRIKCKPFYTYQIDCGLCYCNAVGKIYSCKYSHCAKRLVGGNITSLRVGTHLDSNIGNFRDLPQLSSFNVACTPGVKYRYGCNTCYCTDERHPICTSMICLNQLKFTLQDLRTRQSKKNLTAVKVM